MTAQEWHDDYTRPGVEPWWEAEEERTVNADSVPLSMFNVICDGSACGSGDVPEHMHPPHDGGTPLGTIRVTNGVREWA